MRWLARDLWRPGDVDMQGDYNLRHKGTASNPRGAPYDHFLFQESWWKVVCGSPRRSCQWQAWCPRLAGMRRLGHQAAVEGVLLGGSPRIYVGEGALQRSGRSSTSICALAPGWRSEERRVGKECISRWGRNRQ